MSDTRPDGTINFSQRQRLELVRKMGMSTDKGLDVSRTLADGERSGGGERDRGRRREESSRPTQSSRSDEVRRQTPARRETPSEEAERIRRESWDPKKALRDYEMKLRQKLEEQEQKESEDLKMAFVRKQAEKKSKMRIGFGSLGSVMPRETIVMPVMEQVRLNAEAEEKEKEREKEKEKEKTKKVALPGPPKKRIADMAKISEDMDVDARIAAIEAMVDDEVLEEEYGETDQTHGEGESDKKDDGADEDGKESSSFNLKEWRKQRKLRQQEEEARRKPKKKKRKEKREADQEDLEEDDKANQKKPREEELEDSDSRSRSPAQPEKRPGGPLMTEAEVMAMVKKGRKVERGSEAAAKRIAKEKEEWEDIKKWKPMDAPVVNLAYASTIKKEDGSQLRTAAQKFLNT